MQSVTAKAQDNQIVLEGKAGGDIVGKLLQSFLALRNPAPPVPPPAPEP
jgi:hypothetical protein